MPWMTPFIVLIERIAHALRDGTRWRRAAAYIALALYGAAGGAQWLNDPAERKLARELREEVKSPRQAAVRWARDIRGVRHVQAVVVTDGAAALPAVREFVLASGGVVHAVFPAFQAMTVQLRADRLQALAQRADVVTVSPNREVRRMASFLESTTGALESNVRSGSTKTAYNGLDGSGIGIAILDSGVMREHKAFANTTGISRVKKASRC